jgi:protein-disulfide isomerase
MIKAILFLSMGKVSMFFKRFFTVILLVVSFLTSVYTLAATAQSPDTFSKAQVKAIQVIVHDYLINNPEVLIEVSQSLQEARAKQMESQALSAVKQNRLKMFNASNSPVEGNKASNLAIVEFFDYQCPHCRDMKDIMDNLLKKNSTLKVIYKVLPIFGENSAYAAEVALAAYKEGRFASVNQALLTAPLPLKKEDVASIIEQTHLDVNRFNAIMAGTAVQSELKQNAQLAEAMHLVGTPAFVIANLSTNQYKFISGATTEQNLQKALNSLR